MLYPGLENLIYYRVNHCETLASEPTSVELRLIAIIDLFVWRQIQEPGALEHPKKKKGKCTPLEQSKPSALPLGLIVTGKST
jgi:hypothetical protein